MIVIVTDSTSYLTKQEANELGVLYIPMGYTLDGVSRPESYVDLLPEVEKEMYHTSDVSTSQPGMGLIISRFAKLRASHCEVLCLTISSRLSGTHNNAMVCARELGENGIAVVDTHTTAGAIYVMIKEARRLIDSGLSLGEVVEELTKFRDKVHTYFSVKDLTPLRRSGRLGFVRQSIGTILNQRPILTTKDGSVVCKDVVRGTSEQLKKLVSYVPESAKEVYVQCLYERELAQRLKTMLEQKCGCEVLIREIGPVLGIHLGHDVISTMWVE